MTACLSVVWDWGFFAIFPALNLNAHSNTLEFEWLWLGVYLDFGPFNGAHP